MVALVDEYVRLLVRIFNPCIQDKNIHFRSKHANKFGVTCCCNFSHEKIVKSKIVSNEFQFSID